MSKSQKQQQNRLKREETRVVLIVFDGVLCGVHAYTVTVPYTVIVPCSR